MIGPMESLLQPVAMTAIDVTKFGTKLATLSVQVVEHSMKMYIDLLDNYLARATLGPATAACSDAADAERAGADVRNQDLLRKMEEGFRSLEQISRTELRELEESLHKLKESLRKDRNEDKNTEVLGSLDVPL